MAREGHVSERNMRKHQQMMDNMAGDIIAGVSAQRSITLDCTPGGGKTGAATLLANRLLDANLIDRVLWLVPRLSLAEQVQDAFATGFGSRPGRCIEVVDGQDNLFAPTLPNAPRVVGCVATYQAVTHRKNWERFRDGLGAGRGLIILDEVQFLSDERALNGVSDSTARGWCQKVEHVQGAANYTLLMSGTLWRTDGTRIPLVSYERRDGKLYPLADISYSVRDAVADRAVLPTEWCNHGGIVEYRHNGEPQTLDMLSNDGDEEDSRKVRTFLSGEKTVGKLLDDMVAHWRDHCRRTYSSRMIVMADDTTQAKRWRQYLQEKHSVSCVLATCKEEAAGRQLRHFRERKHGQCLVTVAMAYVGFDCPDLTHLAYLSATRAPSWMLQSFARVSRHDRNAPVDYDRQHAYVFCPDDERIRRFFAWLRREQDEGVADRQRRGGNGTRTPPGTIAIPEEEFEPIDAVPGGVAIESLSGRIDPETADRVAAFQSRCPAAAGLPLHQVHEILKQAGVDLGPRRESA